VIDLQACGRAGQSPGPRYGQESAQRIPIEIGQDM
jgi:hypothetical protein